jgi:hypothetical protein
MVITEVVAALFLAVVRSSEVIVSTLPTAIDHACYCIEHDADIMGGCPVLVPRIIAISRSKASEPV